MNSYKKEPIIGYEEYQIDTNGVVYGKKGAPLKYFYNQRGYRIVTFSYSGKKDKGIAIHLLVAKQFIPKTNSQDILQVNHKDGNKNNNCVSNLEWMTPKENVNHAIVVLGKNIGALNHNAKPIRGLDTKTSVLKHQFEALSDGARYFSQQEHISFKTAKLSLWRALNGYRKTYKKCVWEYVDNHK